MIAKLAVLGYKQSKVIFTTLEEYGVRDKQTTRLISRTDLPGFKPVIIGDVYYGLKCGFHSNSTRELVLNPTKLLEISAEMCIGKDINLNVLKNRVLVTRVADSVMARHIGKPLTLDTSKIQDVRLRSMVDKALPVIGMSKQFRTMGIFEILNNDSARYIEGISRSKWSAMVLVLLVTMLDEYHRLNKEDVCLSTISGDNSMTKHLWVTEQWLANRYDEESNTITLRKDRIDRLSVLIDNTGTGTINMMRFVDGIPEIKQVMVVMFGEDNDIKRI